MDALSVYSYADALWLGQALAERGVGWFEAPLTPEDIDGHVLLSQRLPLLVANDLLWTSALVKELVKRGGQIVVQSALRPTLQLGSAIQFAAMWHVGVATPNLVISEYWADPNRQPDPGPAPADGRRPAAAATRRTRSRRRPRRAGARAVGRRRLLVTPESQYLGKDAPVRSGSGGEGDSVRVVRAVR